jgi:hypothetical protein
MLLAIAAAAHMISVWRSLQTTSLNKQLINYTYDDLGRNVTVQAPNELKNSVPFTIKFMYHPDAKVPYALTQHFDPHISTIL